MLSVSARAGLVLIATALLLVAAPVARADVLCVSERPLAGCSQTFPSLQGALDTASAHPGDDAVVLLVGYFSSPDGFVYSDGGDPANGLTVIGTRRCGKYGCDWTDLLGGPAGGALLAVSGGGGAPVRLQTLRLSPSEGVTGLVLPGGAEAKDLQVRVAIGADGVRLGGTADRPATLRDSNVTAWGTERAEPSIHVTGHALLSSVHASGTTAVRVSGDGFADIRGGYLSADTGVSGTRARVVGTGVTRVPAPNDAAPLVAFEAVCPDAGAPDAELVLSSVTVMGNQLPDATGARAVGRGGDGAACDAVVRVRNTVLQDLTTSLDARGETGSGADPQDGHGRIEIAYSAFDAETVTQTGAAAIADAGGNLDPEPGRGVDFSGRLLWNSVLIDAGDPAPLDSWETPTVVVVNGRRDIGRFEYGFSTPTAYISVYPAARVPPWQGVELYSGAQDDDWPDPLELRWTLSDGTTAVGESVKRTYPRRGIYRERLTAVDPTGRSDTYEARVHVVRQRLSGLIVRPRRVRLDPAYPIALRARLTVTAAAYAESARFRLERAARRGRARTRWVRVGVLRRPLRPGRTRLSLSALLDPNRTAPGRYRIVARTRGAASISTRFRVIR